MKLIFIKKENGIVHFNFRNRNIPAFWGEKINIVLSRIYDVTFEIGDIESIMETDDTNLELLYKDNTYFLLGTLDKIIDENMFIFDFLESKLMVEYFSIYNLQEGRRYKIRFLTLTLYDHKY